VRSNSADNNFVQIISIVRSSADIFGMYDNYVV